MSEKSSAESGLWLLRLIGAGILFPLFFQIGAGIYASPVAMTDSLGRLDMIPLPLSILVCLGALFFLRGRWKKADAGLAMVCGVLAVTLVSLALGGDGATSVQRKALAAVQVLLPLMGLLVGLLVGDRGKTIARAFLAVISLVLPLQLLATWSRGSLMLTHDLYAFSIYSHFQYVTLIFVCAYAYALALLWEEKKVWLCVLLYPMLIYAIAGVSFLTMAAFLPVLAWALVQLLHMCRRNWKLRAVFWVLVLGGLAGAAVYFGNMYESSVPAGVDPKFFNDKFKRMSEGKLPTNLQERLEDWRLFGNGIFDSARTALVGHPQPMPREIRSSPHNWYIDIAYTFGLLALVPVLVLIGHTAMLCWSRRRALDREGWCLVGVVFFLVVVDSNFKVTLRQPYPGIFAWFLWGMLLARLHALATCQPRLGDLALDAAPPGTAGAEPDATPGRQQAHGGAGPRLDTDPLHVSASLVVYKNELMTLAKTLQALQEAGRLAREKYRALRLSLVLVDNSESLGFHVKLCNWMRQFQAELPDWELKLMRAPANLGYGRGNNLAIREAHSEYHVVINPDLFVQDGTLLEALRFMESHHDVGLLTPAVFGEDGQRHYLCKRNPSLRTMFLRSFSPACIQAWFKYLNDKFEMRDFDYEQCIRRVEYPTGCFMFFRTEALKKIGGFDPDFFLHYEDADIGRRMLRVAQVVYVPDVRVVHRWARDTHRSLRAKLVTVRSGLLYWRKWGGVF